MEITEIYCFTFCEKKSCLRNCDGSNYVRSSMFDCSKPKIECSSSITKRLTRSSPFDVRKKDIRVCSMINLVNIAKALLGSMFYVCLFEAINRVFELNHQ